MRAAIAPVLAAASLAAASCTAIPMYSSDDRRAYAEVMKESALTAVEVADPDLRAHLDDGSAGWVVLGSAGVIGAREGDGVGVAHETGNGADTYLIVLLPPSDPEHGFESFRGLVVFDEAQAFRRVVALGWHPGDPKPAGTVAYRISDFGVTEDDSVWDAGWFVDAAMHPQP